MLAGSRARGIVAQAKVVLHSRLDQVMVVARQARPSMPARPPVQARP
ncbi:MAG TPA: hypothetical protein VF453_05340 [Burkholderiaceae bacterium]